MASSGRTPMGEQAEPASTRDRLLTVGQRLFADRGVYQVPLKSIVDGARQRNASALHYHFGNRQGLLTAIIDRHNAAIERERAEMLASIGDDPGIRRIVEAFVVPFSRKLADDDGREFLRIVAQLADLFDLWDAPVRRTPTQAARVLVMLGDRLAPADPAIHHERLTLFIGLVADGLALQARRLARPGGAGLDNDRFVENLIDMAVGALSAPITPAETGSKHGGATGEETR